MDDTADARPPTSRRGWRRLAPFLAAVGPSALGLVGCVPPGALHECPQREREEVATVERTDAWRLSMPAWTAGLTIVDGRDLGLVHDPAPLSGVEGLGRVALDQGRPIATVVAVGDGPNGATSGRPPLAYTPCTEFQSGRRRAARSQSRARPDDPRQP